MIHTIIVKDSEGITKRGGLLLLFIYLFGTNNLNMTIN